MLTAYTSARSPSHARKSRRPPVLGARRQTAGGGERQRHRTGADGHLTLSIVLAVVALVVVQGGDPGLLARADAYATVDSGPTPALVAGLPDHRVYEQVSPRNKSGNYVASGGLSVVEGHGYAVASADGNSLVFTGSGAMGDAVSSTLGPYVARRSTRAWATSSTTPPQIGPVVIGDPGILAPSSDFSRFVFGTFEPYSPEEPAGPSSSLDLYLSENPAQAPAWLGKPTITDAIPLPGQNTGGNDFILAGATPALDTVYFSYSGTLVPQDSSRAPYVGEGTSSSAVAPWGFYEWNASSGLHAAGVLPDGTTSPFGALAANVAGDEHDFIADVHGQAAGFDNEVSADGLKAVFVSPDPVASTVTDPGCEPCTSVPPELYVRETVPGGSQETVLVSQSQLAGHVGEAATHGPLSVADATVQGGGPVDRSYAYASADGSQVFFASTDRLTEAAPEDASVKEYDFDVETRAITYLPGVVGPIVAASRDASSFMFRNTATSPQELDVWRAGNGGGQITQVGQLPEATEIGEPYGSTIGVEARASADGSVFVFDTNAPIPGFANNRSGFGEVYRYETAPNRLSCLSCAPLGTVPSGNAYISYDNHGGANSKPRSTVDTRAMSADGARVFFDSPDPLSPQAANGKRNVYEWEEAGIGSCTASSGCIYLISSGTGSEDAFYLDNSESGNDVFFNTSAGLVTGDTDEAYDAYDARVPHPTDTSPPVAPAPCEAASCAPAAVMPDFLAQPASATLGGFGNVAPAANVSQSTPKRSTGTKKHRTKKRRSRSKHHTGRGSATKTRPAGADPR
jgi:hypothetical protein